MATASRSVVKLGSWEAFDTAKMHAAPSQVEVCYKNFEVAKVQLKSRVKDTMEEKYGNATNPRELLLDQRENQVEYDHAGRITEGQEMAAPKSKYEEDVYTNKSHKYLGVMVERQMRQADNSK